jgi:hypothetical protein
LIDAELLAQAAAASTGPRSPAIRVRDKLAVGHFE